MFEISLNILLLLTPSMINQSKKNPKNKNTNKNATKQRKGVQ